MVGPNLIKTELSLECKDQILLRVTLCNPQWQGFKSIKRLEGRLWAVYGPQEVATSVKALEFSPSLK